VVVFDVGLASARRAMRRGWCLHLAMIMSMLFVYRGSCHTEKHMCASVVVLKSIRKEEQLKSGTCRDLESPLSESTSDFIFHH
jgi:hypothetical protein